MYNNNASKVSATTGLAAGSDALTFADVPSYTNQTDRYYIDYTVNIAAAGEAMTASTLYATIKALTKSDPHTEITTNTLPDYQQATSVDFYLCKNPTAQSPTLTYKGTLNLAGLDRTTANGTGALLTVALFDSESVTSIPLNYSTDENATTGYYQIVMRFYFDGNLHKDASHAFVYSDRLTIGNMPLITVEFSIDNPIPAANPEP